MDSSKLNKFSETNVVPGSLELKNLGVGFRVDLTVSHRIGRLVGKRARAKHQQKKYFGGSA